MRSTIQTLAAPLAWLLAILALASAFEVTMMLHGAFPSEASLQFYHLSYSFLVAWGVELDRKTTGVPAPFEYAAFMFFLWIVLLPVYLFRTRRWRGLAVAAAVIAMAYIPYGITLATWMAIV